MNETNLLEQQTQDTGTTKPDHVPDKFWDAQTGSIRTDELIKSYCELEKRLSAGFKMPEDEEGRLKILRALGLPETPDGYVIDIKDGLLQPDNDVNARLHAKGFTTEQVQEVYNLASERLVPMILDIAAEFQADREIERLVKHFGGPEQWRETSRQLLAFGKKNLPANVLEGLAGSYDGVMALYQMMKGDAPSVIEEGRSAAAVSEAELHSMMRDPKYWRDKDPSVIAKVTQGFKALYGSN